MVRHKTTILVMTWIAVLGTGYFQLATYDATPGAIGSSPEEWPAVTEFVPTFNKPVLVIAIHPKCACSQATLAELRRVMADCDGNVEVFALVAKPVGMDDRFLQGRNFDLLKSLPGMQLVVDDASHLAARFGELTSGDVEVYSTEKTLLYRGGLTGARGHEGDNFGKSAAISAILNETQSGRAFPVFGCSLR